MGKIFACAIVAICLAGPAMARQMPVDIDIPVTATPVEFVFDNNVRKTRDLPTASLRATRRKMISGAIMGPKDLRALADAGDGLAAFRYAKLLQTAGEADPKGAAAHYYAIAAYTGRAFAVPPLARLLKDQGEGYSESRLTNALNAMTVQALSGNSKAATLLGQMYADGVPFGRDVVQAQIFLGMASGGGSPRAALQMGVALMSDAADAQAGHPGARSALTLAASGQDLAVRVTAENLLRQLDKTPLPQPEVTE